MLRPSFSFCKRRLNWRTCVPDTIVTSSPPLTRLSGTRVNAGPTYAAHHEDSGCGVFWKK